MSYQWIDYLGTVFFALAVTHTFFVKYFHHLSLKWPQRSLRSSFFHLLSEVEVVFGFWAAIFMLIFMISTNREHATLYLENIEFIEPVFVFAIMIICATAPIMKVAEKLIEKVSGAVAGLTGLKSVYTDYFVLLTLGPLMGSLITEPAAMTVTALLLKDYLHKAQNKLLYATLALLFVNISIGGSLTPFAAPPILMVAGPWGWDFKFVFMHLGFKACVAVFINASLGTWFLRKEIKEQSLSLSQQTSFAEKAKIPPWVILLHLLFLIWVVMNAHHVNTMLGIFLLFIGLTTVTQPYQNQLKIRESLLVAFFLAGIMVFGPLQKWWLEPIVASFSHFKLYLSATLLTSFTDNAALTYLGTQVPNLSQESKIALVQGALVGGGLTIIANAPNAAGFSILSGKFGGVLNPLRLIQFALLPTLVAFICFWIFPA